MSQLLEPLEPLVPLQFPQSAFQYLFAVVCLDGRYQQFIDIKRAAQDDIYASNIANLLALVEDKTNNILERAHLSIIKYKKRFPALAPAMVAVHECGATDGCCSCSSSEDDD
jgi:hypothetical protein